jgi:hypothetical protein
MHPERADTQLLKHDRQTGRMIKIGMGVYDVIDVVGVVVLPDMSDEGLPGYLGATVVD